MRNTRSLRISLFVTPSLIVIGAFAVIILAFNLIVGRHTDRIAAEHIESAFSRFSLYHKKEENWKFSKNESGYGLETNAVILDETETSIDPAPPWLNAEEAAMTGELTSFYQQNRAALKDGKTLPFLRQGQTYHIQLRSYYGYYDGYLLFEDSKTAENRQYDILVYTNVTPLLSFGATVTQILWGLMACVLLPVLLLLFVRSCRLGAAFRTLNSYISLAGNRKELPKKNRFSYREFYQVAETVRAMTEMIDRAEKAQKQFFANASHELKTPLMVIQGYAEGLQSGVMTDEEKCLSVIVNETQKMSLLVSDILLLSKMDAESSPPAWEVFDLRELLLSCAGTIETAAQQKGLRLRVQTAEAPMPFCGDESGLEKALCNILTNALRYAESEIVLIGTQTDDGISLVIQDDGAGIAPEDLPHIFTRFYKGAGGNFGIGLAITQEVIGQHHGTIAAASRPGETAFHIFLPNSG